MRVLTFWVRPLGWTHKTIWPLQVLRSNSVHFYLNCQLSCWSPIFLLSLIALLTNSSLYTYTRAKQIIRSTVSSDFGLESSFLSYLKRSSLSIKILIKLPTKPKVFANVQSILKRSAMHYAENSTHISFLQRQRYEWKG